MFDRHDISWTRVYTENNGETYEKLHGQYWSRHLYIFIYHWNMAGYNGHSKLCWKNVSICWGKLRHSSWGYLNILQRVTDFSAIREPIFLKLCIQVPQATLHEGFFQIRKNYARKFKIWIFCRKPLYLTSVQFNSN